MDLHQKNTDLCPFYLSIFIFPPPSFLPFFIPIFKKVLFLYFLPFYFSIFLVLCLSCPPCTQHLTLHLADLPCGPGPWLTGGYRGDPGCEGLASIRKQRGEVSGGRSHVRSDSPRLGVGGRRGPLGASEAASFPHLHDPSTPRHE